MYVFQEFLIDLNSNNCWEVFNWICPFYTCSSQRLTKIPSTGNMLIFFQLGKPVNTLSYKNNINLSPSFARDQAVAIPVADTKDRI